MKYLKYALSFLLVFTFLTFRHAYGLHAVENPEALAQEAEAFYKDKKYTESLSLYEVLITKAPASTEGYRGIVKCYSALGDPQGAVVFMESVFLEEPESAEVCYGLGYALYNVKKYKRAKIYFEKAVKINPDLAEAWNNCAVIYHFINHDYETARRYYKKAITTAEKTENPRVLEVARKNLEHLPRPEKLAPVDEKLNLEEFVNRFISHVEENDELRIRQLVLGQKINSEKAMDWFLEKALRSFAQGGKEDEKTTILLARLLEQAYRKNFKNNSLKDKLHVYENLSIEKKKRIVQGEALLEEGLKREKEGSYGEAEKKYGQALQCFENAKDKGRAGLAHVYLGDTYRKTKRYSLARDAYSRGLKYFDETDEKDKKASVLSLLGITSFRLGEQSAALKFLNRSIEIYRLLEDRESEERVRRDIELLRAQGGGRKAQGKR